MTPNFLTRQQKNTECAYFILAFVGLGALRDLRGVVSTDRFSYFAAVLAIV